MLRYLITINRELYLYLAKVIFMLKHSVKLPSLYILGEGAACRTAACVLCAVHSTQHTCRPSDRWKNRSTEEGTDGQSERQMDGHEANSLFTIFLTRLKN